MFIPYFQPGSGTLLISASGAQRYFPSYADSDSSRGTALLAAVAAATSGDLICVFTDASVGQSIAKNGVNWWFAPGATITYASNADGFLWDDGGSAVSYIIGGHGTFVRNTISGAGSLSELGFGLIRVSHASSNVAFDFNEIQYTSHASGPSVGENSMILQTAGRIVFNGRKISTTLNQADGGGSAIWWNNGEMNGKVDEIVMTTGVSVSSSTLLYTHGSSSPTGDFRLIAERIDAGDTNIAMFNNVSNANLATWMIAGTVKGVISSAGGKFYLNAQKAIGKLFLSGGKNYLKLNKIGMDLPVDYGGPAITVSGGTNWIDVDQFEPGTRWEELLLASAGTTFLNSMDLTAATGKDAIKVTGGTVDVLSGRITNGGSSKKDLLQSGGTLRVSPAVDYDGTATTGTITKSKLYGSTPGSTFLGGIAS